MLLARCVLGPASSLLCFDDVTCYRALSKSRRRGGALPPPDSSSRASLRHSSRAPPRFFSCEADAPPPCLQGGNEGGSFVRRFSEWLNATWPHPGHRIVNQGLPAVTSALFAACYDKVPDDSDLVVLDFAVNDGHVSPNGRDKLGYSFDGGARRGFEQLLRKSLKLRGQPAVALLQFFSWNATRDKIEVGGHPLGPAWGMGRKGGSAQCAHERRRAQSGAAPAHALLGRPACGAPDRPRELRRRPLTGGGYRWGAHWRVLLLADY